MDLKKKLNLGATGAFPDGKINPNDEGEIRIAVSSQGGVIRIDFGKPVTWIGFNANEAKSLAALLMRHAGGAISN